MTNKEFYFDKLLAIVLEDTCRKLRTAVYGESCAEKDCKGCEFYTVERVENWLNAEYEPPLLENGDGLKPGDWIMVKIFEDGEWAKRQFAFFHNGWFYYLRGGSNFAQLHLYSLLRSEQARLPEDGE